MRALDAEFIVLPDIRGIAESREQITVDLPGGEQRTFDVISFDGISGFLLDDILGLIPDPGLPDTALSYSWYGTFENQTLFISVHLGLMEATVIGPTKTFQVTRSGKNVVLRQFEPDDMVYDDFDTGSSKRAPVVKTDERLTTRKFLDPISILVVHTALARNQVGGTQADVNAVVAASFGQSNQVIDNSGITSYEYRNVLFNTQGNPLSIEIGYNEQNAFANDPDCLALPGFTVDICRYVGHRRFLRTDAQVQNLRNNNDADLVIMLVADDAGATGLAYTQRPDCGNSNGEAVNGCNPGPAYDPFAVSVVSVNFATSFQVFAHESGHQLGMEHHQLRGNANPSFNFAYGHFVNNQNETVMSTADTFNDCTNCPRALQYSNPNVNFIGSGMPGVPSGTDDGNPNTNDNWNARASTALAPDVSEFRDPQLTDLIFRNGFEQLPLK